MPDYIDRIEGLPTCPFCGVRKLTYHKGIDEQEDSWTCPVPFCSTVFTTEELIQALNDNITVTAQAKGYVEGLETGYYWARNRISWNGKDILPPEEREKWEIVRVWSAAGYYDVSICGDNYAYRPLIFEFGEKIERKE